MSNALCDKNNNQNSKEQTEVLSQVLALAYKRALENSDDKELCDNKELFRDNSEYIQLNSNQWVVVACTDVYAYRVRYEVYKISQVGKVLEIVDIDLPVPKDVKDFEGLLGNISLDKKDNTLTLYTRPSSWMRGDEYLWQFDKDGNIALKSYEPDNDDNYDDVEN